MDLPATHLEKRVLQNGIRLRRLAHEPSLLQRELALRLGISQKHISLYELGEREPDLLRAMEFAIALGTTVERLFHEHYLAASARVADRSTP